MEAREKQVRVGRAVRKQIENGDGVRRDSGSAIGDSSVDLSDRLP